MWRPLLVKVGLRTFTKLTPIFIGRRFRFIEPTCYNKADLELNLKCNLLPFLNSTVPSNGFLITSLEPHKS